MKFYVLIVSASFFASVTGKSEDTPAGNAHHLSTRRFHSGVFGGTYNYAKKHEDSIHGSIKHLVHEGHGTTKLHYGNHESQVHDGNSKSANGGKKGKNKEGSGGLGGYASEKHQIGKYQVHETGPIGEHDNHGGQGHEGGKETYGGNNGGDRGESGGLGSFASGKHEEGKYQVKETSNIGEYSHHGSLGHGNGKGTYGVEHGGDTAGSGGLGSYSSGKHEESTYQVKETSGIGEYSHHGSHGHVNGIGTFGGESGSSRGGSEGLGGYASGKHEEGKYQVKETIIGDNSYQGSHIHEDGRGTYREESGGIGVYDAGKHQEGGKHGGKLSSSIGEYGTNGRQDYNHKGTHWHEERGEGGNFEDHISGTYGEGKYEVHDRHDEYSNKRKYRGGYGGWITMS